MSDTPFMGEDLIAKQAPATADSVVDGVFPDATGAKPAPAPAKKAAKKKG